MLNICYGFPRYWLTSNVQPIPFDTFDFLYPKYFCITTPPTISQCQVNMAHAIKGEKLMEATQSLVTLIANYQNHAKSVKSLLPKQPSAKAKAKAAAKAASVAKGVGDAA